MNEDTRHDVQSPSATAPDDTTLTRHRLSRRRFMIGGAAAGLAASAATLQRAAAQDATATAGMGSMPMPTGTPTASEAAAAAAGQGFVFFTPYQANIMLAATSRLIPTDENGPGATEAGVIYFIDRQLSHREEGFRGPRYQQGPFQSGTANQGDQSGLDIPYRFRLGILGIDAYAQQLYKQPFTALKPEQQDRILTDMENGVPDTFDGASVQNFPPVYIASGSESEIRAAGPPAVGAAGFFNLLLEYTLAGFFADPVHGGNRNMVGWKLIGFPGAQAFVYNKWILRYGEPFTGGYKSLGEYQAQYMQGGQ